MRFPPFPLRPLGPCCLHLPNRSKLRLPPFSSATAGSFREESIAVRMSQTKRGYFSNSPFRAVVCVPRVWQQCCSLYSDMQYTGRVCGKDIPEMQSRRAGHSSSFSSSVSRGSVLASECDILNAEPELMAIPPRPAPSAGPEALGRTTQLPRGPPAPRSRPGRWSPPAVKTHPGLGDPVSPRPGQSAAWREKMERGGRKWRGAGRGEDGVRSVGKGFREIVFLFSS